MDVFGNYPRKYISGLKLSMRNFREPMRRPIADF